jgi:hypothetical protein
LADQHLYIEALSKTQSVGGGWIIIGEIETELGAWSNEPLIAGIENIHLLVESNG